jgi:hypothetical protein
VVAVVVVGYPSWQGLSFRGDEVLVVVQVAVGPCFCIAESVHNINLVV